MGKRVVGVHDLAHGHIGDGGHVVAQGVEQRLLAVKQPGLGLDGYFRRDDDGQKGVDGDHAEQPVAVVHHVGVAKDVVHAAVPDEHVAYGRFGPHFDHGGAHNIGDLHGGLRGYLVKKST